MSQISAASKNSDEIDIVMLIKVLWAQKFMVAGITMLVLMGAAAYAFTAKPLYEARVYMSPPTQNDIADFNYGRALNSDLPPFAVKDIFDVFTRNIFSESLRQTFFEEVYLPSLSEAARKTSRDRLYQSFSKRLVVAAGSKENPDHYSVVVQSYDPAEASQWARSYVSKAGDAAKNEMIKNVVREAEVRARNLEQQINGLRESARREREDRIKVLGEALTIAKSIGLTKPVIISGKNPAELSLGVDSPALYMRGSEALQAEIEGLESRESDNPFIQNLRVLQVKYSFLKNLKIDPCSVAVFRQDGLVDDPDSPIKPNKLSILMLGAGLGIFLAVLVVFCRHFLPLLRSNN